MAWFFENTEYILSAFWLTIKIAVLSGIISFIFGMILTALGMSPVPIMRVTSRIYVNIFRNTPLALILFFCSFGLWQNLDVQFSDQFVTNNMWLSVVGLSAYTAAFVCESMRSGINTIPQGQIEASRGLGLSFQDIFLRVVMPQALRRVVGPLGSVYSAMIKNTTVAAAIGVGEAALVMKEMIENYGSEVLAVFLGFAFGFMLLTLPLGIVTSKLSTKWMVKT